MTFLRSQRSTSTPATGPKKNPGTMRAAMTSETAPAPAPPPMRAARMMIAEKPSQSPSDDTTCTSQRRKNSCEPKRRTCQPGRSFGDSGNIVSVVGPSDGRASTVPPSAVGSSSGPSGSASGRGRGTATDQP